MSRKYLVLKLPELSLLKLFSVITNTLTDLIKEETSNSISTLLKLYSFSLQ